MIAKKEEIPLHPEMPEENPHHVWNPFQSATYSMAMSDKEYAKRELPDQGQFEDEEPLDIQSVFDAQAKETTLEKFIHERLEGLECTLTLREMLFLTTVNLKRQFEDSPNGNQVYLPR